MTKATLIIASLLTYSVVGLMTTAHSSDPVDPQQKKNITDRVDKRIKTLEDFKSCIQSSSTHDDIKACKSTKKAKLKTLRKLSKN